MTILLFLNIIFLGFISIIWSKENWYNVLIKMLFLALTVMNAFHFGQSLGYIVKV